MKADFSRDAAQHAIWSSEGSYQIRSLAADSTQPSPIYNPREYRRFSPQDGKTGDA
jgi:hypothetical protein